MTKLTSLPALFAFLAACTPDTPDPVPEDTGVPPDTELGCPEGEIADGDSCVPEACGTGPWGLLEVDDDSVYVDASATDGGDGTAEAPFATLQAAVDAVAGGAGPMVAIAAGTYVESFAIQTEQAGIHLAGRCHELVQLDVSGSDAYPGVEFSTGFGLATMSGIELLNGPRAGLAVWSGQLTLRDMAIHDHAWPGVLAGSISSFYPTGLLVEDSDIYQNVGAGLAIAGSSVSVTLRDTTVRDGVRGDAGDNGVGITIYDDASLLVESCTFENNRNQGITIQGEATEVVIRDSVIRDGIADPSGYFGYGIQISEGSLEIESSELTDNRHAAISVGGTAIVTVRDTLLADTQPTETGEWGIGIQTAEGSTTVLDGCEATGNHCNAVVADGEGTTLIITDTLMGRGNTLPDGSFGTGLWVQHGAQVSVESSTIEDCATNGVFVAEQGTVATLIDTTIRDIRPDDQGLYGSAISVGYGARLEAKGCTVLDTKGIGIQASDEGTTALLEDCTVTGTERSEYYTAACGLVVQTGAAVQATGLDISDTEGPGILANWASSSLDCTDCTLLDSEYAGLVAMYGVEVVLTDATIQGTRSSSDLGGGVGIYATPQGYEEPLLTVTGSEIFDNPVAGVWLSGGGAYHLEGNTIHGGEGETRGSLQRCGDAIYAGAGVTTWGADGGLKLVDNTLTDGRGAGLFLHDATATVSGNSWGDNAVDLVVQGSGCDAAPDGLVEDELTSMELCPTWDYSTCDDAFTMMLYLVAPESTFALVPPPIGR